MLTYEKAKELQKAGFPQKVDDNGIDMVLQITASDDRPRSISRKGPIFFPTLSELTEACGDDFHCLIYTTKGGLDSNIRFWSAGKDNLVVNWSNGSTPEEAVANLWLALNKK